MAEDHRRELVNTMGQNYVRELDEKIIDEGIPKAKWGKFYEAERGYIQEIKGHAGEVKLERLLHDEGTEPLPVAPPSKKIREHVHEMEM